MTAFRFRLARVLSWYQRKSQLEEERLRTIAAQIAGIDEEKVRVREARSAADAAMSSSPSLAASDLAALHNYRLGARREVVALEKKRTVLEGTLAEQRARVNSLRTRIRLLEKLRERRHGEHVVAEQRELEELAADAYRAASFRSGNEAV